MPTLDPHLHSLLRSAGLRATTARVALLQELSGVRGPCAASGLAERVAATCDRPTVYRNLATLVAAGIVQELGRAGGQSWFRLVDGDADTSAAVFVCNDCGGAFALAVHVDVAEPQWRQVLADTSLLMAGTCPGCLQRGGTP